MLNTGVIYDATDNTQTQSLCTTESIKTSLPQRGESKSIALHVKSDNGKISYLDGKE